MVSEDAGRRLRRCACWAALVLMGCGFVAYAQVKTSVFSQFSHSAWTGRDGAPQGIQVLEQTSDGYLFLGTLSGLYRFDGLRFSAVVPLAGSSQFPSLDISALKADSNGGLWIGYRVGGISHLQNDRLINFDQRYGLPMDYVEQIESGPQGTIWAVTHGQLMKLEGSRWTDIGTTLGFPSGVQHVFFDRSGNLWIAAMGSIYRLAKNETHPVQLNEQVKAVTDFIQDANGTVWISDGWKNVRPIGSTDSARLKFPLRGTANILFDRMGALWIANDYFGIAVATKDFLSTQHNSVSPDAYKQTDGLTSNESPGLFEDREGNIWVGTGLGLDRFQRTNFVMFTGRPLKSFPALAASNDGTIWIGGLGAPLLSVKHGQTKEYGEIRGSGPIYLENNGTIWQYDYWTKMIWAFNDGKFERVELPTGLERVVVQNMTGNGHGTLFASLERNGIWMRAAGEWRKMIAPGLPADSPLALFYDSAGKLWAGYADGTVAVANHGSWQTYGAGGDESLGSVMTLYESRGRIWAGGTNGVAFFLGNGFRRLPGVDGTGLRGISGIVESQQGDLWLNGASGIVRIRADELDRAVRESSYRVHAEVYDFRDGVVGTPAQLRPTPTAIGDSSGKIWFATAGNVFSLDPSTMSGRVSPPEIAIESVRSDGKLLPFPSKKMVVAPKNLQIDYVGLSLGSPQRVIYRYKLDGEDSDWHDAGTRRQAVYSSLRPGKYRFQLASSLGDGQWVTYVLPVEIIVPPAFFQTTWFVGVCLLSLIASLVIGHKLRVRYVAARIRERLEERTSERIRIARELHDTLLQGVQGLMLRFHFAAETIPRGSKARNMMDDALNAADRVIEEGRERVRGLRFEDAKDRNLAKALAQLGANLNQDDSVRFSVITEGDTSMLHPVVEEEMYFIGREAIVNAFLHSHATEVSVEINSDNKTVRIRCCDNGCGFDPATLKNGSKDGHWGLVGMKERAGKIGATLECLSAPGKGTEIRLTVAALHRFARAKNRVLAT